MGGEGWERLKIEKVKELLKMKTVGTEKIVEIELIDDI